MLEVAVDYKLDNKGQIYGFSYHDGYLASFSASESGLAFDIISSAGERFRIHATNVYDFSITDFWNGAIVSNIWIWRLSEVPLSTIDSDTGLGQLYAKRANPEDIDGVVSRQLTNNKNTLLLEINCSYGGYFSCTCAEVRVTNIR